MALIAPENVYTKTAKGILEIRNKSVRLPRELGLVFLSVDGKTSVADLLPRSGMSAPQLQHALNTLVSDGYIKAVSTPARDAPPAAREGEVEFNSPHAATRLNLEAATHALAAADAAKRAQAEARAALDARMREESEARARALAESRADAEAEACAKAEEAARDAADERAQAESEARSAADANERAQAEARARAAAAAAVRAQAEARVRAEAEARARALAETKRAAEEQARSEAETRARNEEQAQARAAAEARAHEALEAHAHAMEELRAHTDNPQSEEAEAARARVRELEQEAESARAAAHAIAEAEGRADEIPQPEMDIADRVRQLNARVSAERRSREEAARRPRETPLTDSAPAEHRNETAWAPQQVPEAAAAPAAVFDIAIEPPQDGMTRPEEAQAAAGHDAESEFPAVDLDRAQPIAPTPEHVPTALERTMALMARAKAQQAQARADASPPAPRMPEPAPEPEREPEPVAHSAEDTTPAAQLVPTIDDDEPLHERLNIDRAAHDIMAENAEARRKAEAEQFSRKAADARLRRAQEERQRVALAARRKRRKQALTATAVAVVALPLAGVAWLQFVPLNGYIPEAKNALEVRLNQPVAISTLRYVLLPTPRLVLEGVRIGTSSGVRVERVEARVMPLAALAGPSSFETVEIHGVDIEQDALGTIPAWTGGRTAGAVHADRLQLTGIKLKISGAEIAPLDGEVAFAPNGTLTQATFSNADVKLELTPQTNGVRVALSATDWRMPYGPPFVWSELRIRGLVDQARIAAGEFTGRIAGGTIEGALMTRWDDTVNVQGDFKFEGARLQDLARGFSANFSARGALKGSGRFAMQAPTWAALTAAPQVEAEFSATRGELTNIDLLRAVQSPAAGAMRGGKTGFEELNGALQIAGGHYVLRRLQLVSGPLRASGTVDVGPGGRLDGRLTAELATRGARSTLLLGGTLEDPQLKR